MKIIITLLLISSFLTITVVRALDLNSEQSMTINARVSSCILTFRVYPEKRIPSTNNWSNETILEIFRYSSGVKEGEVTATTDSQGQATVNLCENGMNLVGDEYIFRVKGLSHLRKNFGPVFAFDDREEFVDLTVANQRLLAGETSPIFDNVINSMDISTQINYIYSTNIKNDLNRDNYVNSLDISNTITNFFLRGD